MIRRYHRPSEVNASRIVGFAEQNLERTTEAFKDLSSPGRAEIARKVLKNSKIVAIRNIYA